MQTKLAILRSQLNRLRRQRAGVRWACAICAPAAVALWMLVAAFLFDWSLNFPQIARGGMLVLWMALGIAAIRKYAWPFLVVRESLEDVALIVERHHQIDSDLVAALQFENPLAKTWGASRLTDAVVNYVAEFSPSLNVFEGFSYEPLPRRAVTLVATLLLVIGLVAAFPAHATAFWTRFLLGSAHYPTRTDIEAILINGSPVPIFAASPPVTVRLPYGQTIALEVRCAGEIPSSGFAQLTGINSDSRNRIELVSSQEQAATFTGEAAHISDSFRVNFLFGDAVSDPTSVIIVPLPLVDISWSVSPPAYAVATLKSSESDAGSRQLSVLEGSNAEMTLTCSNKRLKSARMLINGRSIELVPSQIDRPDASWSLPAGTPFATIQEALKYEIQVTDQDDLSLETPITGQVRLKTDRHPRVVASAVTRQVLPTASPKLDFAAGDDFGVAKIVAMVQISREDGRTSRHEILIKQVPAAEQPVTILRGQAAIPLGAYELAKGDEVNVTLEVTDWRGDLPGQPGRGESNHFDVTDLNGILAQTGEEDRKSAKQLDEILRRELGIGGEKK